MRHAHMRILISVHAHIPTLIICVCVCVCVFSLRPSGFVFGSNGRGTLSRSTKTQCPQKFWHSPMQTHRARTHANPRPVTPPDTPPATPATGSYDPQGDVTGAEHVPPTPTAAHQEGGEEQTSITQQQRRDTKCPSLAGQRLERPT